MAEPKHYQFILDGKIANDFKTEINKIGGKIQNLSDAQVVVNFDENVSMANFKKLYQKLEKENSDLTVQFRYDINKAMLEHARKELSNMEIYVDKSKAEQAIKELGQKLQSFNIRLNTEDLDEKSLDDLYAQGTKIADKIGKIISTHLKINGQDLFKNLPNELQEAVSAFRKISQLKTIEPLIIDTKVLEAQRQQIEQITVAMEQLVAKGATDKIGTSDVDDSKIQEIKKDIAEVKEDITSLKGRVDTLEDTTAFDTLSSQVEEFDERIKNVDGSVENLVNSFKLLSELSLTDLQKVAIPLFNEINQVYQEKNGKQISGYWDKLKEEVESSNAELREFLKLVGLYNSRVDGLKLISNGMVNSGGLIGDNRVLIARKNTNERFEQTQALKNALNEAYNAGVNVSRILDVIGTKESNVFLEVQETANGNILGNIYGQLDEDFVNQEWFEATDEQIKKLISDMITLQKIGINVESNLTNIMYDKEKGFSFIDMDLDITKFENNAELMEDHMVRIFGDLEDFYLDKNDSVNANIVQKIRERFENLSEQVQQAYAEAQDSHSPSKEFEKLENDAVDGIVKGANDNSDKLKNVGKQMAQDVKDGFKEGMAEASATLSSGEARDTDKIVETNKNLEKSYEKVAEAKRKVASKDNTPKLASKSIEDVTPEITNMDKLEEVAEEAAQAKKDFATANEGVQDSVDGSKSKLELETELMERLAKSAREAADAKKEFAEANQLVAQNEQTRDENAEDEAEKLFDTANLLKQLDNQYTHLFDTQEGKSNDYKQKLQELEEHISKIRNLGDVKESDTNTVNQIKEWNQAAQNIIKDLKEVKKYVLADSTAISKLSGDIADTLHKHTAMPKELAAQFEELQVRLSKSNMLSTELEEIRQAFVRLKSEMKITGSTGISMMDKLKRKYADVAVYFASYVSIYDFINVLKDGIQTIRDYDIGLTEMNKVSKENLATLKEFQQESFKLADSIGATASAIQNSTADWMRLGEAMTEAAESAQATNILFNVSEFESIDEATDSLVAMSQAYKDLGKMDIVDIMNNVGNNFSISTDGLASALQKSASALTTAGNDINEAVALITAGNAIAQDPDSVGAGLRTISLRLVGTEAAKAELEALGEETDDVITTTSKLRDTILAATKAASQDGYGFDILDDNGNYKSTFEIMSGLSELYDEIAAKDKELGTNNLNLLLETIAGKNRANIAASILQNYDLLQSVYKTSLNSEGSALKENEAYLESIEGKINQLSNAWDALWVNENNREVITFFLDLAKSILETVDAAGGLKTILIGSGGLIGAFQLLKNDGRPGIVIYKAVSFHMPSMSMF